MEKRLISRASKAQRETVALCNTIPKNGKYREEYIGCVKKAKAEAYILLTKERGNQAKQAGDKHKGIKDERKNASERNRKDYENAKRKKAAANAKRRKAAANAKKRKAKK